MDQSFWDVIDKLVAENKIVIDRPKGSPHPRYPDYIYPFDYGYLEGTQSQDGGGIDVWVSEHGKTATYIVVTVDGLKKDSEIKILIGCNQDDADLILGRHRNGDMQALLIPRPPSNN